MEKGDMLLKILVRGKFVDLPIKEGEIFLLPGRIPHSPQRFKDTVGLVIERDRSSYEIDCLRWYVPDVESPPQPLYEAFFHCTDLVQQLKPVITDYYASEQKKTGKPLPGTIMEESKAPIKPNSDIDVPKPVQLGSWVQKNLSSVISSSDGFLPFEESGEFKVIFFAGNNSSHLKHIHTEGEAFIWQWEGTVEIHLSHAEAPEDTIVTLKKNECFLVQKGVAYRMARSEDSQGFVIRMVPL